MTDLREKRNVCERCGEFTIDCTCLPPTHVTHEDLANETKTVMRHVAQQAETIRDQLTHLNKIHTLGMMAASLYGKTTQDPDVVAKNLYQKIALSLEKDRAIVGQIRSNHEAHR